MQLFGREELSQFEINGYLVVRELLSAAEVELLGSVSRREEEFRADQISRADGEGGSVDLVVKNDLPEGTIHAAVVRSERIVRRMEQLLDDEVYHYHHKMILKEPRVGGAWAWHQDYGYWYHNGCLFPRMGSCMVAVDRATQENGCLQVLAGSHSMGRVEHTQVGEQTGADPERVEVAVNTFRRDYVELDPGDAVFFHCNLMHRSDQNSSEDPRWAFICCYNAKSNDPYKESHHPRYSFLDVWPDSCISEVGQRHWERINQQGDEVTS
ncbi:MAG: phytanoyl-CoA dioxygenase family protein [Planctomycetaceae bacterium]|nr:phytanoyl-CoA dioxygenase family protein [Planctomycetaceae bacterium]